MKRIRTAALLALLVLVLFPTLALGGTDVKVGLVWTLAGENYLGFEVLQGTYRLEADGKVIRPQISSGPTFRVGNGPWGMALFEDGNPLLNAKTVVLTPVQGNLPVFTLYSRQGMKKYRGSLTITVQPDRLLVVNTLGEQEYLYGVVPVEMSNSWAPQGLEALKAQAIAARTYLRANYDPKLSKGYNISDSPNIDQAYAGYGQEGAASKAVDATAGEILVDKATREPVTTAYHAHSGGHTEDSEHVWRGVDSHLRGKPDPFSFGQGFAAERWEFNVSAVALGRALGIGPVEEVKLEKFASGRVKSVMARDSAGNTINKSGREFAGLFYPKNRGITSRDFLGNFFSCELIKAGTQPWGLPTILDKLLSGTSNGPRLDRTKNPYPVYRFTGSGWGHGVGMSQWGAYGMARQGYNYRQILEFYYSNIDIDKD